MPIKARFTVKSSEDLIPGELVRLEVRGEGVLAVILPDDEVFGRVAVALQPSPVANAFQVIGRKQAQVTSYGSAWIIEPTDDSESFVGNRTWRNQSGVLKITSSAFFLRVQEPRDNATFDLNLSDLSDMAFNAKDDAPVVGWVLWASDEHRNENSPTPLLTFKAVAPE